MGTGVSPKRIITGNFQFIVVCGHIFMLTAFLLRYNLHLQNRIQESVINLSLGQALGLLVLVS